MEWVITHMGQANLWLGTFDEGWRSNGNYWVTAICLFTIPDWLVTEVWLRCGGAMRWGARCWVKWIFWSLKKKCAGAPQSTVIIQFLLGIMIALLVWYEFNCCSVTNLTKNTLFYVCFHATTSYLFSKKKMGVLKNVVVIAMNSRFFFTSCKRWMKITDIFCARFIISHKTC